MELGWTVECLNCKSDGRESLWMGTDYPKHWTCPICGSTGGLVGRDDDEMYH